ncbi:hypothetical protein [Streptomyces sp. NPDC093984]|uniref:hypothetical protein n=1 Tax=Streptomyces sp. NPDC093984 TaxID=3366052 RepID=UPI003820C496
MRTEHDRLGDAEGGETGHLVGGEAGHALAQIFSRLFASSCADFSVIFDPSAPARSAMTSWTRLLNSAPMIATPKEEPSVRNRVVEDDATPMKTPDVNREVPVSIVDIEELIQWGKRQPRTLETKQEIIRRKSEALTEALPLFRFMQENQATMKELRSGEMFRQRMLGMRDILLAPDAALVDQVRCVSPVFTIHAGMITLGDLPGTDEEKRKAVLEVATTLVTEAHLGRHAS